MFGRFRVIDLLWITAQVCIVLAAWTWSSVIAFALALDAISVMSIVSDRWGKRLGYHLPSFRPPRGVFEWIITSVVLTAVNLLLAGMVWQAWP